MRLKLFAALGAVCLSAAPAVCADGSPADARILRVAPSSDISELDPTKGSNLISRIYSQMVFDTLFALDGSLSPKPMMVERYTRSDDGLLYTFVLRPGLKFHDGSPVTTKDVTASLERWMQTTSIGGQLRSRVAAMAITDERTFTLTLTRRFGLVEFMLAGPGAPIAAIMREADARRPADAPMTRPIGSGPFRYVAEERQAGNLAVFERNADYLSRSEPTDGLAGARTVNVDRIEWRVMPDATTAANALATGEIDFWDTVGPDLIPFLRKRNLTVRRTALLPSVAFIRPNFQLPPFNDVRAREALALLTDQAELMTVVAGEDGKAEPCYSFSVCGAPFGTEAGSEPYRQVDIPKAKRLLAEAGYKGEPIVLLGTPQLAPINAMTQVVGQRLKEAGVNVDVQMTDFPGMLQRINAQNKPLSSGGYNLFAYYAIGSSWFHPLMNVSLDMSCTGRNWPGFPCDDQGEALRQAFLEAPDDGARRAAFEKLQARAWQFLPYIPAGQFDVVNAYRSNISGVLNSYVLAYWNIEKR